MTTTHRFVSWIRFGAAALRNDATTILNPVVTATVTIDGQSAPVPVSLYGPGDVTALAASAIVRRDPTPDAIGVSPIGLAFVELSPADLPWRFSPAPNGGAVAAVQPWLALIVVPASAAYGPKSGASTLVVTADPKDLPNLAESWAWSHVQVEEPDGGMTGPVGAYVRDHASSAVARVIAPRKLEANTKYRACLVPIYEASRRAALGIDLGDAAVRLAWDATTTAAIDLPVYDSWLFSTGDIDDFETIARRLHGADPDGLFAPLTVDVSAAGGTTATMYGLLRPPDGDIAMPAATQIASTIEPWLATDDASTPVVGPPLYAAAQTGAETLTGVQPWQRDVNLDPRRRAQAAAGAAVVRADQEQLVADARDALGKIDQANTFIRGAQLATLLADRVHTRHVASRPPARVLAMLWPNLAGTPVATAAAAPEPGAAGLLAPAMRRMTRPNGPLARGRVAGLAWSRLGGNLTLRVTATALNPASSATMGAIRQNAATTTGTMTTTSATEIAAARTAEISAGLATRAARAIAVIRLPPVPPVDTAGLASQALAAAAPLGIATRLGDRITGLVVATIVDLGELRGTIDLSRPFADRLAELRPEMFAPGLAQLPPDIATVLKPDPAAVEAILVGANDELTRELDWRGIRIDRTTTLLRQLWARPARDPGPAHDIDPITGWTAALGSHASGDLTVFVVRSELVRRFPSALFACVRAVADVTLGRKVGDEHLFPLFQGTAAPDTAYIGFAKSLAELAGADNWKPNSGADPGWYFTIQERPGHTRFGLDAAPSPGTPAWDNLAWSHVHAEPYVDLSTPPTYAVTTPPKWGATAAGTAAIFERPAVRVSLHVRELMPR